MTATPPIRRKLFMHPAHPAIGVSSDGIAAGPYCRIAGFSTDGIAAAAMRVSLVAQRPDADARAAMALFQRALDQQGEVQCDRVELAAVGVGWESLADADCVVVFGCQLQMARHWSDLDLATLAATGSRETNHRGMETELVAAAQWHPVLEGVDSFVAHHATLGGIGIPADATLLLTGRWAGEVLQVAWVRHRRHGRVFQTTLGSSEDFRHPDFMRLALNAAAWIAEIRA